MLKFIKNWTLPIAMLIGTLAYLLFAKWAFLAPLKPVVNGFVSFITPWLIFAQLLLTFCKIDVKELIPKRWHLWLLMIQGLSCALMAGILLYAAIALFQLATLPVEFNASRRAMVTLRGSGMMNEDELGAAREVLTAAALTYVAALVSSLLTLLRLVILAGGRRRN